MRSRLAPWLLAAAGCVEDVPIAAECPPDHSGPCLVEVDGSPDPSDGGSDLTKPDGRVTTPVLDAGPRDAAPFDAASDGAQLDATTQPDAAPSGDAAAVDAGTPDASQPWPYAMPAFGNASFEFANSFSVTGDVTTITSLTTNISPWYTCQTVGGILDSSTGVRVEAKLAAGISAGAPKVDVDPTDGKTFLTMGYWANIVPVPVMQPLQASLIAGQRYAFAIDVLATSDSALLALEVLGNTAGCFGTQTEIYTSAPITSLNWTPVCVSFTAPSALPYLMLSVNKTAGSVIPIASTLLSGPRLLVDNIRQATPAECPEL